MPKKKPERIHLQASAQGLEGTITSLTGDRSVESGPLQINFLDAVLHADGRDSQVLCYDPARDVSATLYGFPIELLKYLEVARLLFEREDQGNGNACITFKNGAFSSIRIQRQGQDESEIDIAK
ncbi:MAG TPA: hypothetical protein VEL69_08385, partial [Ktedonobacteraceae bacterium]|nr:hypothetical protein [Ktedonobacteraceae bacterium]